MNPTSSQSPRLTLTSVLRKQTTWIVDPVVSLLAKSGVSPNTLTVVGLLAHILFAWLIAGGRLQLAGLAIALISPLDALDGALARKLDRALGKFGAFLDSTSDRLAEIILFAGFIFYFVDQDNPWMAGTAYAALTGSLMVSYARSRAGAMGVQCEVGLLTRVERYLVITLSLILSQPEIGVVVLAVFTYVTFGQRMYHVWQATRVVE